MKYKKKEKLPVVLPTDWRKKLDVRCKSRQLLAKGIIKRQSCQLCYQALTKMVHVNYDDPMNVIWLCEKHYLIFRREKRRAEQPGLSST